MLVGSTLTTQLLCSPRVAKRPQPAHSRAAREGGLSFLGGIWSAVSNEKSLVLDRSVVFVRPDCSEFDGAILLYDEQDDKRRHIVYRDRAGVTTQLHPVVLYDIISVGGPSTTGSRTRSSFWYPPSASTCRSNSRLERMRRPGMLSGHPSPLFCVSLDPLSHMRA
jgi:hypothetical protein